MFKKVFIPALLIASLASSLPASAQIDVFPQCGGLKTSAVCNGRNNNLFGASSIWTLVINTLAFIAGGAAVIVIIITGFKLVFSSGTTSKVMEARETIIYASIGLILVIAAASIVDFIITLFT